MHPRSAPLLKRIGRRVAEAREARGLTQEKCAELLKVTPRYLQRVEAGEENLTIDSLVKLGAKLKVDPADFFVMPVTPTPRPGRPKKSA